MITANDLAFTCAFLMGAHWLHVLREGVLFERRSKRYERDSSRPLPADLPMVSVLVPARNEEGGITKCLESLVAQDHPRLEIIAIDDRSTDRTGQIMEECASRSNGRLKVIHVDRLPDGWLGKNHALHLGSQAIAPESKYLLFTDGDVIFAPDTLGVALRHCEENGFDHFVLSPLMLSNGPWLATVQLVFGIGFLTFLRPSRLGKSKDVYVGIGAFNLVRRTFYEKCGGHVPLRLEVCD
ncbi:MAG: glycosyltransferase family 2 protein, partial [Bdellovibrionota bacterium]